ncbi:MAG: 4a-hydroxytetrahydrobiopterin dehydratase [Calditrichaeota bacterium]|nr:4a-hydroxytetrahydrobiopterin dehydratase [Calditrichota bacterium]RQV93560.1 MAG: 4a-hydroxytetrahydrobiopterin dehydratase [bacterium]RQW08516.1 MAG: 4a-hydroxytetrahydrobiopterin dehydratase [Calditrichota bacterium]
MEKLNQSEIQQRLTEVKGWKLDGNAIKKEFEFSDFSEAMKFINQVADLAESHNHHPELYNVYNKVSLRFSTHDAGGITTRDFRMATDIDKITE